jgi:hypothetical protein
MVLLFLVLCFSCFQAITQEARVAAGTLLGLYPGVTAEAGYTFTNKIGIGVILSCQRLQEPQKISLPLYFTSSLFMGKKLRSRMIMGFGYGYMDTGSDIGRAVNYGYTKTETVKWVPYPLLLGYSYRYKRLETGIHVAVISLHPTGSLALDAHIALKFHFLKSTDSSAQIKNASR